MRHTLAVCLLLTAACSALPSAEHAGQFSVRFTWASAAPTGFSGYAAARVESRPGDSNVAGVTLATAGPTPFAHGMSLAFNTVPNQNDLVVVAELRSIQSLDGRVLYYGLSEPFTLQAGKVADVEVRLAFVSTPASVTDANATSVLSVVGGTSVVADPNITLQLFSDRGAAIRLSNVAGFPTPSTQTQQLAGLSGNGYAPAGFTAYAIPWNIAFGAGDIACAAPSGCLHTVYAQIIDGQGYASDTVSLDVTLDQTAPSIVASASLISPASASASSSLVVNVVADEGLAAPPVVYVGNANGSFVPLSHDGDTTFSFVSSAAAGSLWTDGVYQVTADLADYAGNTTHRASVGAFQVITSLPDVVVADTVLSPNHLKDGSVLNCNFTLSKAVAATPVVRVGTTVISTCQPVTVGSLSYTCTQPVALGDGEGYKTVSVQLVDTASNRNLVTLGSVNYDFTPPSLGFALVAPSVISNNQNVIASLVFSEPLVAPPVVNANANYPMFNPNFTYLPSSSNTSFELISPQTGGGAWLATVTVMQASDLAGNAMPEQVIGSFSFTQSVGGYRSWPVVSPSTVTAADVQNGNDVSITFSTMQVQRLGYPQVSVGTHAVTCNPNSPGPSDYLCLYKAIPDVDGVKQVTVVLDNNGNGPPPPAPTLTYATAVPTGQITVQPPYVGAGGNILITLNVSEPLTNDPNLTITLPDGTDGSARFGSDTVLTGAYYSWSYTLQPTDPSGVWHVTVDNLVDYNYNVGPACTATFTTSQQPPAIAASTVTPLIVNANTPVTATVTTTAATAAGYPQIVIGSTTIDCVGTANTNQCSGTTARLAGPDGVKGVFASIVDQAGNGQMYPLASVTLDTSFSASSLDVSPPVATDGSIITVQYLAGEALANDPTLAVTLPDGTSGTALFTGPRRQGLLYTWAHPLAAGDPDGAWTYTVSGASDLAGNSGAPLSTTTQVNHAALWQMTAAGGER